MPHKKNKKKKTSPENFVVNFCNPQNSFASQPKTPHGPNLPKNPPPSRLSKPKNISMAPWGFFIHPKKLRPPKLTSEVSALCPLNSALVLEYLVTKKKGRVRMGKWLDQLIPWKWWHKTVFFGFLEGEKVEDMQRPTRCIWYLEKDSFFHQSMSFAWNWWQAMREKLCMSFGCNPYCPTKSKILWVTGPLLKNLPVTVYTTYIYIYRRIFSIFCVRGFLINSDHKNHHKIQTIFWHPNVTRPPGKSNVSVNPILTSAVWIILGQHHILSSLPTPY